MAIKTVKSLSSGRFIVELPVTYNGLAVTVGPGEFTYGGEQKSLSEDFEVTLAPDATHDMTVKGILVWDTQAEEYTVVIDEVLFDGIDRPFDFGSSEQYERIAWVFRTMLVPGQTSIDDGTFEIHVISESREDG